MTETDNVQANQSEDMTENTEQTTVETPVANQSEVSEPTVQAPVREKVKAKHLDSIIEVDPYTDEGIALIQQGLDYPRIKARNEKDQTAASFLSELAKKNGYEDVSQYVNAYKEYEKQQEIAALAAKNGIPEEIAQRLMGNEQRISELEKEKAVFAERKRQDAEYAAFSDKYPDVKAEDIPQEVWDGFNGGKSLVDEYAKYENSILRAKLAEYEKQDQAKQKNNENAQFPTASLSGGEPTGELYFTKEQVEKMSRADLSKNFDVIESSMKRWK